MSKENASQKDKHDMLTELHVMKCLKSHNHVVQMIGYSTRSGEYMINLKISEWSSFQMAVKIKVITRLRLRFLPLVVCLTHLPPQ